MVNKRQSDIPERIARIAHSLRAAFPINDEALALAGDLDNLRLDILMDDAEQSQGATPERVVKKHLKEGWQPAANAVGADPLHPPRNNPPPRSATVQSEGPTRADFQHDDHSQCCGSRSDKCGGCGCCLLMQFDYGTQQTLQVGHRVVVEGILYRLHDNGRTATVEFTRREGDSMAAIVPLESVKVYE